MAAAPQRGMPILSGPPPLVESSACRQCGRDFNPLWRRSKACGHCGYEYCSSCIDEGHALMPRRAGQARHNAGPLTDIRDVLLGPQQLAPGYDVEPVCRHCLGMLQVTAAPPATLRTLPLKRLKEYLTAYDIKVVGVMEKEDIVQAALAARSPATGCLLPEHESYYRRKSVPRQGRIPGPVPGHTPRQPPPPPRNPYAPRTAPTRPPPPRAQPQPQQQAPRPQPRTQPRAQPAPRPAPSQPRPPPQAPRNPPPPVPTILSLVPLPKSYLSSLSIGTLKAVLYDNHVRVDFKQVLEKNELIDRVHELVEHERRRLERQRIAEEREAAEVAAALAASRGEALPEPIPDIASPSPEAASPPPAEERHPPTGPAPDTDRGLCVVCQDSEATLAVVDCGHLAMCQQCSDLIMATTKECPLCRTRIVTPQRLIRIYRV